MRRPLILSFDVGKVRTLGVPILEAHLHDLVLQVAEKLLPIPQETGARLVVAQELALPYGRPDLVVGSVDMSKWRSWKRARVQPCTAPGALSAAFALERIGAPAPIDALLPRGSTETERDRLRSGLAALSKAGWVVRDGALFSLRATPGLSLHTVAGVEAKLNNWRRAVRQVQSWEPYVDAVWLAFPSPYLRNLPRTQGLRRYGLIGVDPAGARFVRRPTGPKAVGVRFVQMEQYLYARWLGMGPVAR